MYLLYRDFNRYLEFCEFSRFKYHKINERERIIAKNIAIAYYLFIRNLISKFKFLTHAEIVLMDALHQPTQSSRAIISPATFSLIFYFGVY